MNSVSSCLQLVISKATLTVLWRNLSPIARQTNKKTDVNFLRTFALIVCAHPFCAGNATVRCHASLRWLVPKINMASKTPGKKISGRFYSFGSSVTPIFLIMNHLLYLLSTKYDKMKKISPLEVICFFNFLSSCHRNLIVVVIDRAYENARRGWTLLFTTSLAAWNYLKIPPLKTYARKPSL